MIFDEAAIKAAAKEREEIEAARKERESLEASKIVPTKKAGSIAQGEKNADKGPATAKQDNATTKQTLQSTSTKVEKHKSNVAKPTKTQQPQTKPGTKPPTIPSPPKQDEFAANVPIVDTVQMYNSGSLADDLD